MKDFMAISEKYKKFLLKILFRNHIYYSIAGADLSDNEDDKILIDGKNKVLLFSTIEGLMDFIPKSRTHFDNERMQAWAVEAVGISEAYVEVFFDGLSEENVDISKVDLFETIYHALGLIKDYAIQVDDGSLLGIFEMKIITRFNDDCADYFLWRQKDTWKLSMEPGDLMHVLNSLYRRLARRITIVHSHGS